MALKARIQRENNRESSTLKNNPRVIFGWAMYDWANSAYFTTTAAALLPAYFAEAIVPPGGYELFGRVYDGQTLWGYLIGFGTFIIFLITPILGAIADFSAAKKRFLQVFAYGGALFATSFVFVGTGDVLLTMGLFFLTQIGFVSANVFYDGFLTDITTPESGFRLHLVLLPRAPHCAGAFPDAASSFLALVASEVQEGQAAQVADLSL